MFETECGWNATRRGLAGFQGGVPGQRGAGAFTGMAPTLGFRSLILWDVLAAGSGAAVGGMGLCRLGIYSAPFQTGRPTARARLAWSPSKVRNSSAPISEAMAM